MTNPYKVVASISHKDIKSPGVLAVIQTWSGKWRWRSEIDGVPNGYSKATALDSLASALSALARDLDVSFEGFRMQGNLPYSGDLTGTSEARQAAARLMSEARKADRQITVQKDPKRGAVPSKLRNRRPPPVRMTVRSGA